MEGVAKQMIFELIVALIVVESIFALMRLKSGQSRLSGPSWRVTPRMSRENSSLDMRQMSSRPRNVVR
jgi:hypothetical protein